MLVMSKIKPLRLVTFGKHLIKYLDGLHLQDHFGAQLVGSTSTADTLVLLQHSPVYTIGKRGKREDFKVPLQELLDRQIDLHHSPRGGEVTYHGPGQLVAYPIVKLKRMGRGARAWVEGLEDTLIDTLGDLGVHAKGRVPGATGVWVEDRKIAAIGVRISQGVSTHGIALNVSTDLSAYDAIVPCGIEDKSVTSVRQEMQRQGRSWHTQTHTSRAHDLHKPRPADTKDASIGSAGEHQDMCGVNGSTADAVLMQQVAAGFAQQFCKQFGFELTDMMECVNVQDAIEQCKLPLN